ncbi:MAG: antitoxin [Actinomycetes bacterium]
MSQFDNLRDKAEAWAKDHPEKAEQYSDSALERAAHAADKATGDRFKDQVEQARKKADDLVGEDLVGRDGDEPSNADRAKAEGGKAEGS